MNMTNLSKFCTCHRLDCKLHPANHDKGCSPCIIKNLNSKEIPECFFKLLENANKRNGDFFKDFAEWVLKE